ncbi:MAG TPA: DUF2127 domain-containing protein [Terriglobales bacterium]|nr:DUF2127 domain-containing protein [Terriglobales bacterium]
MADDVHQHQHERQLKALRAVASLEFIKGLAVLLAGCGLLSLVHRDVWGVADSLLGWLHLSPDHRYARMFLNWADEVTDSKLMVIAGIAFLYSVLRFVEAYGLWRARAWAEWLAMVSGAIYVPFEVFDLMHKPTLIHAGILLVNLIVVGYMIYLRLYARAEKRAAPGTMAESCAD